MVAPGAFEADRFGGRSLINVLQSKGNFDGIMSIAVPQERNPAQAERDGKGQGTERQGSGDTAKSLPRSSLCLEQEKVPSSATKS